MREFKTIGKKMNIIKYMLLAFVIIFTTGCSTYSMTPSYDETSRTLSLDNLTFQNSTKLKLEKGIGRRESFYDKSLYRLGDDNCELYYRTTIWPKSDNWELFLKKKYSYNDYGSCSFTKISNLKFFQCQKNGDMNSDYSISTSMGGGTSYSGIEMIRTSSMCFDKIKNHYATKAKKENIKIVESIF